MFPVMITGPCLASIWLNRWLYGRAGLKRLLTKIFRGGVPAKWYLPLLIPPAGILAAIAFLHFFVSAAFTPNFFLLGVLFGIPAGLLEETGWMGFAFPALRARHNAFVSALLLGILWSLWHLPVIDFLGAASPHGPWLSAFFLSFMVVMSAMRIIIAWVYSNTGSVFICQLMHITSTGSLVILGPATVTPWQETLWYGVYGAILWIIALAIKQLYGNNLATGRGGRLPF
jgi:membrane protease YdiL (CAAX protease family)